MAATLEKPQQPAGDDRQAQPRRYHRVKTPTVLQMEAVECGAAALAIILAHHGKMVPLEELRTACGVSRDGSKASNLLRAARNYGLIAKGFRMEPEPLRASPLPVIVFWNFNHYLVVEGFGKDRVYLNDPASGPRSVTAQEFNVAFTGVALTFERGPEFRPGGAKHSLFRSLRPRLRGSESALAFAVLASLALVVPGLALPAFIRSFVDGYLVHGLHGWIEPLLLGMAITAVLRAALTWLQQHFLLRLETKIALSTSSAFFWHVLQLPVEFYMQRFPGEIGSRVAINDRVAQLLSGELATAALGVMMIVFYAIAMFRYDVPLTLVSIAIAVLNVVTLRYTARRRIDSNRAMLQERGKLMGTSMGGLQAIETLKATGAESDFFARWAGQQANLSNAERDLGLSSLTLTAAPPLLTAINVAAILGLGGLRIMHGDLTIGMLVAFQTLMASFLAPVNQLVRLGDCCKRRKAICGASTTCCATPNVPTRGWRRAGAMVRPVRRSNSPGRSPSKELPSAIAGWRRR